MSSSTRHILIQGAALAAFLLLCWFLPPWGVLILAALVLLRVLVFLLPTRNADFKTAPDGQHALLVVDMQNDLCGVDGQYPDGHLLIETVNAEIEQARAAGSLVLFVRQEFPVYDPLCYLSFGGRLRAGADGAAFAPGLAVGDSPVFIKHRQDSFSCLELEQYIEQNNIAALALVGLDAAACIQKTAFGARNRGLSVSIVQRAVDCRLVFMRKHALRTCEKRGVTVR